MQTAVFAIMGVVALVIGLVIMLVLPGIQTVGLAIIGLGIILVSSAGIMEFRRVRSALASKRGRFSASTTIMVSVFAGIILLVNAIGVWKFHRFDFTGLAQFTLTTQTKDALANLKEPVEVLEFFTPGDATGVQEYAKTLITEYQNHTDKLIVSVIDPDADPETARRYFITDQIMYQSVVFQTKNGARIVPPWEVVDFRLLYPDYGFPPPTGAEHAFTSAILEVSGTVQKKIYFLTGHGEADPDSTDASGYGLAASGLRDNLFRVEKLDLLASPQIPEDAAVLVVAAPKVAMDTSEKKIIADYLRANGSVLFLVDPDSPPDVAELLKPWGVEVIKGAVVEPKAYSAPNKNTPLVDRNHNYNGSHTNLYFPGVAALFPLTDKPKEIQIVSLAWATADSWVESDLATATDPKFDEGVDLKGPEWDLVIFVGPGVVVGTEESEKPQFYEGPKIAIAGDSDFANNRNFQNAENGVFFVNVVNNLAAGKELISIDRKVLQTRKLVLSPEEARFLNYSSVALLPIVILVIGGVIWWRRR